MASTEASTLPTDRLGHAQHASLARLSMLPTHEKPCAPAPHGRRLCCAARNTPAPSALRRPIMTKPYLTRSRKGLMLDWLGVEGDRIAAAFERVFRQEGTPFGSFALRWGGMHDGTEGVQWNVGMDPRLPERWVSVNLEGLRYDGWPLARLIANEMRRPTLPALVTTSPQLSTVRMSMDRELWTARNRVHWESIADLPLADITEPEWRRVLAEARSCLASRTGGRGRGTFAPKSGGAPVSAEITPHLAFRVTAVEVEDWERFIRDGLDRLDPLYEWTEERTGG